MRIILDHLPLLPAPTMSKQPAKAGALEQLVEEQQEQAGDRQADEQGGDSPQSDQEPAA